MTKSALLQHADQRSHARRNVLLAGRLRHGDAWLACEVVNLSAGGAKLRVDAAARGGAGLAPGQELTLELAPCGLLPGVAAWVREGELGLRFTGDPARLAEALIGLATYG